MAGVIRVAVTGAAGQVAYSMLARLASGEVFGPQNQVVLQLLEITPAMPALEGVAMELEDCAFPNLKEIILSDSPEKAFDGVNWAMLVGSFPRKQGMERKELLGINGKIFVSQGKALAAKAAADVRVLVVGNPCNTNCLVARANGREIPAERWSAMTRLDHNRAQSALAKKAGVLPGDVTRVTIWGNHSNTQFPDFANARIQGKPAEQVIGDRIWLEDTFVPMVQTRGAAVIKARGLSSAMSAANGALSHVKSLLKPTAQNDWVSMAVVSNGEYGIPAGMIFGYPCTTDGQGNYQIVAGLEHDAFAQGKIQTTLQELREEMDAVKDLLPG
ncbi:MAG: malate dehydrogenase [Gemmataceae bacterium]|nr:malate dehydrogenase [Gemmataceae bacterium]